MCFLPGELPEVGGSLLRTHYRDPWRSDMVNFMDAFGSSNGHRSGGVCLYLNSKSHAWVLLWRNQILSFWVRSSHRDRASKIYKVHFCRSQLIRDHLTVSIDGGYLKAFPSHIYRMVEVDRGRFLCPRR